MATGEDAGAGGSSSWWGNLVKNAKEKSQAALVLMKTDLAEFTNTMATDTTSLVNQASEQFPNALNLMKPLFGNDGDEDTDVVDNPNNAAQLLLHQQAKSSKKSHLSVQERYVDDLASMQELEQTYTTDPKTEVINEFNEWAETFDAETVKTDISELLIANSSMRLLYAQLVPQQVTNALFWARYFFKVNMLEEDHKKRLKLIARGSNDPATIKDEDAALDWDDDNEENDKSPEADASETLTTIEPTLSQVATSADQAAEGNSIAAIVTNEAITPDEEATISSKKAEADSDDWADINEDLPVLVKKETSAIKTDTNEETKVESNDKSADDLDEWE